MELKVVAERKAGFTAPIHLADALRTRRASARAQVDDPRGQERSGHPAQRQRRRRSCGSGRSSSSAPPTQPDAAKPADGKPAPAPGTVPRGRPGVGLVAAGGPGDRPAVRRSARSRRRRSSRASRRPVRCKVDQKTEFDGKAKVELVGLPPTTAHDRARRSRRRHAELVFHVKTDAKTPAGQHNQPRSAGRDRDQGRRADRAQHRPAAACCGSTSPPPKPNAPAKPAAAAAKPPRRRRRQRPLTRLEKLRLEQAAKAAKSAAPATPVDALTYPHATRIPEASDVGESADV